MSDAKSIGSDVDLLPKRISVFLKSMGWSGKVYDIEVETPVEKDMFTVYVKTGWMRGSHVAALATGAEKKLIRIMQPVGPDQFGIAFWPVD